MADVVNSLSLLFDRPSEPLITPKGEKNSLFQLTEQFLNEDYSSNGIELNNRFGEDASVKIPVKNLSQVPQFNKARQLPVDENFSLFIPSHQEYATEVIDVLMGVPENQLQDFLSTCIFARENLNPQLFNYCYSVALMHRRDTRNVPIQNFAETFPSKFLDSKVFSQAREVARVTPTGAARNPIIIPRDYTATDLEEEHRLAYFREDIGVNLHHWHWHLVYPFTASDRAIVAKDRRGELFFYMHQQIIARYNGERLNNSLKRVKKFNNWREPIPEAYYPKLDSLTSARGWPPRQSGMRWQNLNRPADNLNITLDQMERQRRALEEAIATGRVQLPNGSTMPLDIDTLGNMVEASILSPNPQLYGTVHNNGHTFSAYVHDPEHRYLESFSPIADEATTMRDPFFYRWHAWIDDLFQSHKESSSVPRYTRSELDNPGVAITSATIQTQGGQANTLNTFWMQSDVDLSRGLDFSNRGPVFARFTHLNHRPFSYVINVNNTGSARRTTVRIFLSPKFDERNLPWNLNDQRKMFIEMDRFVVPLNAGQNTITRQSTQSTVTIPFEQTFRDLSVQGTDPRRDDLATFNYCGCGWPQHMLVPKGTEGGAQYEMFVMCSNYDLDRSQTKKKPTSNENLVPLKSNSALKTLSEARHTGLLQDTQTTSCIPSQRQVIDQPDAEMSCDQASSFCGLKDRLFPDKRTMGFPFDRPSASASSITDFMLGNMALTDVTIRLQNTTEVNPRNPTN